MFSPRKTEPQTNGAAPAESERAFPTAAYSPPNQSI